jgi:hypothetical protein
VVLKEAGLHKSTRFFNARDECLVLNI